MKEPLKLTSVHKLLLAGGDALKREEELRAALARQNIATYLADVTKAIASDHGTTPEQLVKEYPTVDFANGVLMPAPEAETPPVSQEPSVNGVQELQSQRT